MTWGEYLDCFGSLKGTTLDSSTSKHLHGIVLSQLDSGLGNIPEPGDPLGKSLRNGMQAYLQVTWTAYLGDDPEADYRAILKKIDHLRKIRNIVQKSRTSYSKPGKKPVLYSMLLKKLLSETAKPGNRMVFQKENQPLPDDFMAELEHIFDFLDPFLHDRTAWKGTDFDLFTTCRNSAEGIREGVLRNWLPRHLEKLDRVERTLTRIENILGDVSTPDGYDRGKLEELMKRMKERIAHSRRQR